MLIISLISLFSILDLLTVIAHESRNLIWNNKIIRIFAHIIYDI